MIKILVVDDETNIGNAIKRIFRSPDFFVRYERSAKKIAAIVDDFMPNVLITDVIMPEKDGLELIREIKTSHPDLPMIAISGGGPFGSDFTLETAQLFGAVSVFSKPFENQDLYDAVMELVSAG